MYKLKFPMYNESMGKAVSNAFTLVELLIVITIMAFIGVYTIANYGSFGEDQKLKSATADIQNLIRQSQTNASAKVKCQTAYNATWQVIFASDRKTITLGCLESTDFYQKKVINLDPSNIQVESISRAGLVCPADVGFPGTSYTIKFDLLTGKMDLGEPRCTSFTVSLQSTKTTNTKSISMTSGGAVKTRPSCDASSTQLNGLVGYWDFDEGSGDTVADKSGYNNMGTITGATRINSGKIGKALSFNSTDNNRITIANTRQYLNPANITVSGWFQPNALTPDQAGIVSFFWWGKWGSIQIRENGSLEWAFYYAPSGGSDTYSGLNSAPGSISTGSWYHFAVTYDSASRVTKLYLNGSQVASGIADNIQRGTWDYTVSIGTHLTNVHYSFNGSIDEVRIYNRALSPAEIRDSYNSNAGCSLF